MTLRKTLIGALASFLILAGLGGQAVAQNDDTTPPADDTTTPADDTTTPPADDTTTPADTTTPDDTTTPADDTTPADADTTVPTDANTTGAADTTTSSDTTTPTETTTPTDVVDSNGTGIAEAFETQAPNPQAGAPAAPADGAAAPAAPDQVLGETELAFTGSDPRVSILALVLLGAGASLTAIGRRKRH